MDVVAVIGSVSTIVSVVTFAAIVAWACSRRRRAAFDAAANAPFALPDEATGPEAR
jgi:cbb3-type cytochrome oxidase subunit 3